MSKKAVEAAIGKAILDAGFRELLLADPDQALSDFNLVPAEKNMLKRMDSESLDMLGKLVNKLLCRIKPQPAMYGNANLIELNKFLKENE